MIQLRYRDPEFGARAAAKAYELLGPERARELLDAGSAVPIAQVVAEILAATPPTGPAVAASAV
jgi:hypothetical protein